MYNHLYNVEVENIINKTPREVLQMNNSMNQYMVIDFTDLQQRFLLHLDDIIEFLTGELHEIKKTRETWTFSEQESYFVCTIVPDGKNYPIAQFYYSYVPNCAPTLTAYLVTDKDDRFRNTATPYFFVGKLNGVKFEADSLIPATAQRRFCMPKSTPFEGGR